MDLASTKIAALASSKMRWASERQKIVAENIANADTPRYRARDLVPFSALLSGSPPVQPARTHPAHLAGTGRSSSFPLEANPPSWGESISGNNVVLEEQMVKAAETKSEHELAATLYQKSMNLMSAALRRD